MRKRAENTEPVFLGIECGGTRSVALWVNAAGREVQRVVAGSANLRLLDDEQLVRHFRTFDRDIPLRSIAIGMAGARTAADRARIHAAAATVWPGVPCYATNDLETGLMAADRPTGKRRLRPETRVLVLSGTGSCCFGRSADGTTAKVGGWGHYLDDRGSGYDIAKQAIRDVLITYDRSGKWPRLGQRILRALQLNEPDELIGWAQSASKADVAALAIEIFAAAEADDRQAVSVLDQAMQTLVTDATSCAHRLIKPGDALRFVLAGSVLLKQPAFAGRLARRLGQIWPRAEVTPLERESAWGAVRLAFEHAAMTEPIPQQPAPLENQPGKPTADIKALTASPTEQRNPRSMELDRMSVSEAIELMLSEDAKLPAALRREKAAIEQAIKLVQKAFKRGGRLFYVGAGTSGRLGVLDASECPPTFQTPPEMVQGIMAGGYRALWSSIEGAEDSPDAGAQAVAGRGVDANDVVAGIAASGRTPFVWGALAEARTRGARTVLLGFNPYVQIPADQRPDVVILPNVGPEILTGSTRLKAGTATKMVLNMLTTLSMVGMGKVISNLMVDVKASNAKLRDRATRILQALTGLDYPSAQAALVREDWQIQRAFQKLKGRDKTAGGKA